jgi:tetratricopeptide (TPR) repeat protein
VLIAVPLVRGAWHVNDEGGLSRQLALARQAFGKTPPDIAQVVERTQKVFDAESRFPQFAAEAHFLFGSAKLTQIDPANPDMPVLAQVQQHLEQADRLGVADTDKPKLSYRLAKTLVLLGTEPAQAISRLAGIVDAADDPAEAYGLLAQAYLKQETPDVAAAIEATKTQLAKAAPSSDAKMLAQARLRLGELYLKQNNAKEGRAVLERIGADAPSETFYLARAWLADSYEASQDWSKAARNWEQVRSNTKLAGPAKGSVLYRLGRCYLQDQRPKEAAAIWTEASTLPGEEGQAAALRLAELKAEADPKAAAESFAAALQSVRAPAEYRNALVPVDEARQILERAAAKCRAQGDAAASQRLIELYARLAPPGRDDDMAAQAADAAAQGFVDQSKLPGVDVAALMEQARSQYLIAARAYERAAGKVAPGADQAQWLWKSADRYLKAQQQQAALDVLTRMTQLEGVLGEENIAEAWFQAASIHHQKQQYAAARAAYQHCLTPPGRFTFPSRHQLAMLDLLENKFNEAELGLQENRTALRAAPQPDAALLEQTEYALANVAYQRQSAIKEELREYTTAEQRYLGALQQYPDSAEAPSARFYLGQCYVNMALQKRSALDVSTLSDEERKGYRKQYADNFQKAFEQFDKLEEWLTNRQKSAKLSVAEEILLWKVSFATAECTFYLTKFDEAIRRYSILAVRYQGQIGELGALSQLFQCYSWTRQTDKAKAVLARMHTAYDKMPDSVFTGGTIFERKFWLDWLAGADKQQAEPPKPSTAP